MKRILFVGMLLSAAACLPLQAQHIEARISVKVIVSSSAGNRPIGITDALFYTAVSNANRWMDSYWRGYRYAVTEITNIGGPLQGGTNGPSKWFGVWPSGTNALQQEVPRLFQEDTRTNSLYLRRTNAVNFYITRSPQANTGGWCPIPPDGKDELSCFGVVNDGGWWVVHEAGHFFGLNHTFGGCQCADGCSYFTTPNTGDDGIADTLPEADCYEPDQIAQINYGSNYAILPSALQVQVDNVYSNVMSYHNVSTKDTTQDRKTELQLDHFTTMANWYRRPFVSGFTRFVSPSGVNSGGGTNSTTPFRTVGHAVNMATAGQDILLLRPGNYNEQLTINKAVTLRATRAGWVTIGGP